MTATRWSASARAERRRDNLERRRRSPRWPWLGTVVVVSVVGLGSGVMVKAIAAVLGIAVVVWVGRKPLAAVTVLLVLVPFHQLIFVTLYRLGAPTELVRQGIEWKEILIIGIFVTAIRCARAERHRLDAVDVFGLLYVGLGLLYLELPGFFAKGEPGATLDFTTRLLGWRTDVLYVALFLACRHLRLRPEETRRLVRAVMIAATVVAAIAVFEFFFSSTWNRLWMDWLDFARYKLNILHSDPVVDRQLRNMDIRVYTKVGGRDVLRAGSVMLDYNALASYLVIAVGLLADSIVRGVASRRVYAAMPVVAGALLLTETRSAILAAGVVLVITLLRRSGRSPDAAGARVRFTLIVAGLLVLAVPVAASVGLVARFNGQDDYSSNQSHQNSFDVSYGTLVDNPLGQGLATSAGAGQRANVTDVVVTETEPLQIGVQLGFFGLALWAAFMVGAVIVMGVAAGRSPPKENGGITGIRTAFLGLLVGGLLLQNFIDFSVTWTAFGLAGCILGSLEGGATELRDDVAAPARAVLLAP